MKKTEKDKLKNAFNIPEPVHKEKFISKYGDMLKKNEHKLRFSMIVKYSACTAFAVLIIGVWGIMNVNPDFADKFRGDNIVESAVTTSAGTSTNTVNMTSVVTNTVSTESNKINHITSSPTDSVTGSVSLQTTSVVSSVNSSTGKISTSKTQTTKKDTPSPNKSETSTELNAP
ncbi:MAG: hypothetical protein K2N49_06780, partial [Ruminococcus sp.]|nr:hypothetical protein [Ruminococcus sp.]